MKKVSSFEQLVGLADDLPLSQKEVLVEVLSKRLIEDRRSALRDDIRSANQELKSGKCKKSSPAELMKEIMG